MRLFAGPQQALQLGSTDGAARCERKHGKQGLGREALGRAIAAFAVEQAKRSQKVQPDNRPSIYGRIRIRLPHFANLPAQLPRIMRQRAGGRQQKTLRG
ncbi:hypothetical protein [Alloyangia pacifica]|uniref:hypothetical protein n=1 Tax=Alloyangia pacifica TaxID=311180 RepID=UPI001CFDF1BB|nr:hypothetical protein [Alloyangia pacifica]